MTGRVSTIVLVVLLAIGVFLAEAGWRGAPPAQIVDVPVPAPLASVVDRLRSLPQQHVTGADAGAVAAGVVFGRADDVDPADQQAFLDSGLQHLVAASGQNIALVATCCILLARCFGAGKTTGAVLALIAIPIYVMVVGSGASIVRAGITGMLGIVAWLTGRLPDLWRLLLVAAVTTCWIWPGAHRSLGMQLSFACVAALLRWASPMTTTLHEGGVPSWLAGAVAATTLCSLATAPILQLRTGGAPATGTLANLVAVPMAGALLVVGLGASLIALAADSLGAEWLGTAAFAPVGLLASALLQVARRAAAAPAAQATQPAITIGVPLLVLCWWLAARVAPARGWVRRAVAIGACVLVLGSLVAQHAALPLVHGSTLRAGPHDLRIAVLDIGQGDATLLVQGSHAVLVDTGPPDGHVVDRVHELGVRRVDGVVLTHDSLDHRGGLDDVVASLHPRWTTRPINELGAWRRVEEVAPDLVDICAGDGFDVGEAHVSVLHPRCDGTVAPRTGDLHNDGATVLLVKHGSVRALIPADAEAPVLLGLGLPHLDLLRISHHGSADPQLPQLLDQVTPAAAAISVGEGNDYGHPRAQVLDDLRRAHVLMRRTDRDGTIEFRSDGTRLSIVE